MNPNSLKEIELQYAIDLTGKIESRLSRIVSLKELIAIIKDTITALTINEAKQDDKGKLLTIKVGTYYDIHIHLANKFSKYLSKPYLLIVKQNERIV